MTNLSGVKQLGKSTTTCHPMEVESHGKIVNELGDSLGGVTRSIEKRKRWSLPLRKRWSNLSPSPSSARTKGSCSPQSSDRSHQRKTTVCDRLPTFFPAAGKERQTKVPNPEIPRHDPRSKYLKHLSLERSTEDKMNWTPTGPEHQVFVLPSINPKSRPNVLFILDDPPQVTPPDPMERHTHQCLGISSGDKGPSVPFELLPQFPLPLGSPSYQESHPSLPVLNHGPT